MSERKAGNGALSACQCCMGQGYRDRVARGSETPSAASERYFVSGGVLFVRLDGCEVPLGDVELLLEAVYGRPDPAPEDISDHELPGMWSKSDFTGGPDE